MGKSTKLVLGLTGPNCAGKGEVCKYLGTKNFFVCSLSDILREIATQFNIPTTLDNLAVLGNQMRILFGPEILAKLLIRKIGDDHEKIVIDSIRNVGEIMELKKFYGKNFYLIHITAPTKLRFKFCLKRNRAGDPKSYKEFLMVEKRECSDDFVKQQIKKCKELSDFFIVNNSTLDSLYRKIDNIISKL